MTNALVIYCPNDTERLRYTINWLFTEQLKLNFRIVTDSTALSALPFFIAYGSGFDNALSIADSGLLWERGINAREITTDNWNNIPTLFADDTFDIPFDIFSAIFFLISRYEEYYPYTSDKHGRYPATESLLYKKGWMERPLIDEWITQFRKILEEKTNNSLQAPTFSFLPTYDIDIAYSYLHKGTRRTAGAYAKDLLAGKFQNIAERKNVLSGSEKDPYDSFDELQSLHQQHKIKPIYFILAALTTTDFDKNINPLYSAMQQLIKNLSKEGSTGMHPSYYSDNEEVFEKEKTILESISAHPISISRQHYIKMQLPTTYEYLVAHGIEQDYSMGYATHIGFRAGTGRSFRWYNLAKEETTSLRVYPFCFMDTTARFEMNLSVDEVFNRLQEITTLLKENGSLLITIFHNFSLGTDEGWNGWKEKYALFLNEHSGSDSNY